MLLNYPAQASVIDPCVGTGAAFNLITTSGTVERYGVELDARRADQARATGIRVIQGNAFDAHAKVESFSLLYLNPPYDSEINRKRQTNACRNICGCSPAHAAGVRSVKL